MNGARKSGKEPLGIEQVKEIRKDKDYITRIMAEALKQKVNTQLVKNENENRLTAKAPKREPGLSHQNTVQFLAEKR